MQSDVWCLLACIDDDGSCITGSKYLEYNPGLELNFFIMNNEQWTKESNENKDRTKWINIEQ